MLLDDATEGYLLPLAIPDGATTLVGFTNTDVLRINAGGNVSSSGLASSLLSSPVVLPAPPPSSGESLPSSAFSNGGDEGVAWSLEKPVMSLHGLPMSLVESIEGCGFGESPDNLSFIALGDFKEL